MRGAARHHKGGEHRYLRIMSHKARTKEYKEFAARYYLFHPDDVVELCADHHEEIHVLYAEKITSSHAYIRLRGWDHVRLLVNQARKLCDEWLLKETPGVTTREYTYFPPPEPRK